MDSMGYGRKKNQPMGFPSIHMDPWYCGSTHIYIKSMDPMASMGIYIKYYRFIVPFAVLHHEPDVFFFCFFVFLSLWGPFVFG